jgi:signal transduction histidine kinase
LVQRALGPAGPGRYEAEYRIVRPDGETRWVRDTGRSVSESEADARRPARVIGTVQDITERKRSELELQRLNESLEGQVAERTRSLRHATGELLLAEARERRELAIEMHDSLGQELALARMKLADLARALDRGDSDRAMRHGQKAADLIEQADRSSRVLIHQLSPHALDEAGLAMAVRTLAEEFHGTYGLQVDCSGVDDRLAVPDEQTRVVLYRAIRELLLNVLKHAGTNSVSVAITCNRDQIGLTVCDAGAGFDLAEASKGSGLFHTRERIENLAGAMQVESEPGKGTKVIIEVPR